MRGVFRDCHYRACDCPIYSSRGDARIYTKPDNIEQRAVGGVSRPDVVSYAGGIYLKYANSAAISEAAKSARSILSIDVTHVGDVRRFPPATRDSPTIRTHCVNSIIRRGARYRRETKNRYLFSDTSTQHIASRGFAYYGRSKPIRVLGGPSARHYVSSWWALSVCTLRCRLLYQIGLNQRYRLFGGANFQQTTAKGGVARRLSQ